MNPQLIEFEELAEEKITGGSEPAEQVLGEDHHFILCGSGNDFIPWGPSLHVGRNQAS